MNFDDHAYDVEKNDYVKRTEPKDNGRGKMKYKVITTATAVWEIEVEADSKDEARDKVFEGDYDQKFDTVKNYINEEVHDVQVIS
jgi:hypothetical protein